MAKTKPAAEPKSSKKQPKSIPATASDANRTHQVAEADEAVSSKLGKKVYEEELARLQLELIKLQEWIRHAGGPDPGADRAPTPSGRQRLRAAPAERAELRADHYA